MELSDIKTLCERVRANINRVIVGKEDVIDLVLITLVVGGHVLLEDVPGMGKTMLAKTMAKSIDCGFNRIQFTPDLLPSDLTGINFYDQKTGEFRFRPGAIFTNILLGDEINRATPRTQSALLECMEERQVTIDGVTSFLDAPFMVIATQNPVETQGTFPLPEAQLDRFLVKLDMGYPSTADGVTILTRFKSENPLDDVQPVATGAELIDAQKSYTSVHVSDSVLDYIVRLTEATRKHPEIVLGVSPRGSQALLRAVQMYAVLAGRDYVTPDDVKAMVKYVFAHRIILKAASRVIKGKVFEVLSNILLDVDVPTEEIHEESNP